LISDLEIYLSRISDKCWVMVGNDVFDVTGFVDAHPGGRALITDKAREDVSAHFNGETEGSHAHSDNARRMLKGYHIGRLSARTEDEKRMFRDSEPPFLDLCEPLITQLWRLNP